MTHARSVSLLLIALVCLGLVTTIVKSALPPGAKRQAADTYSGTQPGHRALLEVYQDLGVDAARTKVLPPELFQGDRRVLLLSPDPWLLTREQGYLRDLAAWVRAGGELLLVSDTLDEADEDFGLDYDPILLELLGLADLEVSAFDYDAIDENGPTLQFTMIGAGATITYPLRGAGTLAHVADSVSTLCTDRAWPARFSGAAVERARGMLEVDAAAGVLENPEAEADSDETPEPAAENWKPVALEFGVGEGSVTLVATPHPFTNIGLGQGENAPLAAYLGLGDGSRSLVIDDYYHGLVLGDNWLALALVYPYGSIALFMLIAAGLVCWRYAVRFGPPVPDADPSRRDITEYVDAMARLFRRARAHGFVLEANRAGFLASLREAFHLPQGAGEDVIRHRFAQAAPGMLGTLDALLSSSRGAAQGGVRPEDLDYYQERFDQCLQAIKQTPKL